MRIYMFALFLIVSCLPARSQETVAKTESVTVRSGQSVRLGGNGIWSIDSDTCQFIELQMDTLVHPSMGRVVGRLYDGKIPATAINQSCVGLPIKAFQITYTANKKAKGTDRVMLQARQVNHDRRTFTFEYVITIE
ncbi:MAG: hypothetical protein HY242_03115 [Afipia sp.]|nr:hypothetical protein [Afipia sp.]